MVINKEQIPINAIKEALSTIALLAVVVAAVVVAEIKHNKATINEMY